LNTNNRGFTLLELLISITMLALITGILSGAVSLAVQSLNKGEKKIVSLERTKTSFLLVESQIQSLLPYQFDDQGEKKLLFMGKKDNFIFSSSYSIWGGKKGNTQINYLVGTDEKGRQQLEVTENTLGMESKREAVLFREYDKIYFEYYLKDALEEGKWVDEWPADQKGLPGKVKINFVSGAQNISLTVHIFAKAPAMLSMSEQPKPIAQ
jgi:prepilin-type N-terminal cleavage/methylation domain-containing protein